MSNKYSNNYTNTYNRNHDGFSLLEVIVFIGIFAAIMAIGMSTMQRQRTWRYERETFIARLNALLFTGWKNAITTNKLHRISWDLGKRKVIIAAATDAIDSKSGETVFKPLAGKYSTTSLTIPETIKIENFIIEGYDEMKKYTGNQMPQFWFYLAPNGLTQEVTINFWDMKDRVEKKPRPIGLVLNPFNAQFESYDTFKK